MVPRLSTDSEDVSIVVHDDVSAEQDKQPSGREYILKSLSCLEITVDDYCYLACSIPLYMLTSLSSLTSLRLFGLV